MIKVKIVKGRLKTRDDMPNWKVCQKLKSKGGIEYLLNKFNRKEQNMIVKVNPKYNGYKIKVKNKKEYEGNDMMKFYNYLLENNNNVYRHTRKIETIDDYIENLREEQERIKRYKRIRESIGKIGMIEL